MSDETEARMLEIERQHCKPVIAAIVELGSYSAIPNSDEIHAIKGTVCRGCVAERREYIETRNAEAAAWCEGVGWTVDEAIAERQARAQRVSSLHDIIDQVRSALLGMGIDSVQAGPPIVIGPDTPTAA
jgi:hypothetical protein